MGWSLASLAAKPWSVTRDETEHWAAGLGWPSVSRSCRWPSAERIRSGQTFSFGTKHFNQLLLLSSFFVYWFQIGFMCSASRHQFFFSFLLICSHEPKQTEFQEKPELFPLSINSDKLLMNDVVHTLTLNQATIKGRNVLWQKSQPLEHNECSLVWHKVWQQGSRTPSLILRVAPF